MKLFILLFLALAIIPIDKSEAQDTPPRSYVLCTYAHSGNVFYMTDAFAVPSSKTRESINNELDNYFIKMQEKKGNSSCYLRVSEDQINNVSSTLRKNSEATGLKIKNISWLPSGGEVLIPLASQLMSAIVNYPSIGSALGGNGYSFANVPLRYRFIACSGEIHMAYGLDPKGLRVGNYIYNRKTTVTARLAKPQLAAIGVVGRVKLNNSMATIYNFADSNAGPSLGFGCFTGQTRKIGLVSTLVGPKARREVVQAFLNELRLVDTRVEPDHYLRNAALERP